MTRGPNLPQLSIMILPTSNTECVNFYLFSAMCYTACPLVCIPKHVDGLSNFLVVLFNLANSDENDFLIPNSHHCTGDAIGYFPGYKAFNSECVNCHLFSAMCYTAFTLVCIPNHVDGLSNFLVVLFNLANSDENDLVILNL